MRRIKMLLLAFQAGLEMGRASRSSRKAVQEIQFSDFHYNGYRSPQRNEIIRRYMAEAQAHVDRALSKAAQVGELK